MPTLQERRAILYAAKSQVLELKELVDVIEGEEKDHAGRR